MTELKKEPRAFQPQRQTTYQCLQVVDSRLFKLCFPTTSGEQAPGEEGRKHFRVRKLHIGKLPAAQENPAKYGTGQARPSNRVDCRSPLEEGASTG